MEYRENRWKGGGEKRKEEEKSRKRVGKEIECIEENQDKKKRRE